MPRVLITGGGGFVGKALGQALVSRGFEVISVARGAYPELKALGISHHQIDLSKDLEKLITVSNDCDAIFHVAAKVDMWGKYEDFFAANVLATRNVIQACKVNNIKRLIFTSSPSVIADGKDLLGVNETYPYPSKYMAFYPQTKAQAEKEVLQSNNSTSLKTIALRPHLIWGRGDTNLIPTVVGKAEKGKLLCIGDGSNLTDLTYIDDCVQAHIKAFDSLETNPAVSGKPYFISQGDPVNMWQWVDQILTIHKLPVIRKKVNKKFAMLVASVLEAISRVLPGSPEPLFTKFLVCEMSTSHYFDISAAKNDLGYEPQYSVSEAMKACFSA